MSDGLIPPLNAPPPGGVTGTGVQPGVSSGVVIASIVIVYSGGGISGVFLYSPGPGTGNLVASWTVAAGTDQFGNAYQAGLTIGPASAPQALLATTGTGGQGAALQFLLNTADMALAPLMTGQVINGGAVNQFLQLLIQGPAGTGNNGNQFNILFNSDSDDGTEFADLLFYDKNGIPFLAMANSGSPQMYIGQDPNGSTAFIPVTVNGALLTYGQATGGQVVVTRSSGTGTIPIPAGVAVAKVECLGAQAGGQAVSGPGGGSGEYACEPALAVTIAGIAYSVGAGGTRGTSGSQAGGAGGDTTAAGTSVTVHAHGAPANNATTTGGLRSSSGGSGSTNTIHVNGSGGSSFKGITDGGGGGAGAPSATAQGQAGPSSTKTEPGVGGAAAPGSIGQGGAGGGWGSTVADSDATGGGTGGGSGGAGPGGGGATGGVGRGGFIKVTYTLPGVTQILASMTSAAGTDPSGNAYPAGFQGQMVAVHPGSSPSTAEVWQYPALVNGWANSGAPNVAFRYKLLPTGDVFIQGAINGAAETSATCYTLPTGYYNTTSQQQISGIDVSAAPIVPAYLQVSTTGVVTVNAANLAHKFVFSGLISPAN